MEDIIKISKERYEEVKNLAKENYAEFHTVWNETEPIFSTFKFSLTCKKHNHHWEPAYSTLKNGTWCKKCGNESANQKNTKDGAERMALAHAIADENGGWCLEDKYKGYGYKMLWKCDNDDHPAFLATYINTVGKQRSWCPHCGNERRHKRNTTEGLVRKFFEIIFDKQFPSLRPSWNTNQYETTPFLLECEKTLLKYKHKEKMYQPLELDGFNSKLNLAFEYDGYQHFELLTLISSHKERMKVHARIKITDFIKAVNCKRENITLIRIPYMDVNRQKNFNYFLNHIKKYSELNGICLLVNEETESLLRDTFQWKEEKKSLNKKIKAKKRTINKIKNYGFCVYDSDLQIVEQIKFDHNIKTNTKAYEIALNEYFKYRDIRIGENMAEDLKKMLKARTEKKAGMNGLNLSEKHIKYLQLIMGDFKLTNKSEAFRVALLEYKNNRNLTLRILNI